MDIFIVLKGGWLRTQSGKRVYIDKWDLGIFHPPCTFIANSSAKHLYKGMNKKNGKDPARWKKMKDGALFFKRLWEANIPMVAVENPVMLGYAMEIVGADFTQSFQPWEHGHMEVKRTCLWLRNLPPIKGTKNVYEAMMKLTYAQRAKVHHCAPGPDRAKIRSTTYPGFARAIVKQWGKLLVKL